MSRQWKASDTNTWTTKYGDGSAGNLTFTGGSLSGSQGYYRTTITGSSGSRTASLGASWSGRFICLIHQSQGDNNGVWEFNVLNNSSASTTANFEYPLQNTYTTGAQIVTARPYKNITLSGTATMDAWDGSSGGIFFLVCNGTFTNNGTINAQRRGYRRATYVHGGSNSWQRGGENRFGFPTNQTRDQNNGAGGGGQSESGNNAYNEGGAGGGGHATAGGNGSARDGQNRYGYGGATYGSCNLDVIHFGSPGGQAGRDWQNGGGTTAVDSDTSTEGNASNNGGGIIVILAPTLNAGTMNASGYCYENTSRSDNDFGGNAGSAGGTIVLYGDKVSVSGNVTCTGSSGRYGVGKHGRGGDGGQGYIGVYYGTSLSGGTSPSVCNGGYKNSLYVNNYTITLNPGTGGTITPNTTSVTPGTSVTYTVKANSGYYISAISLDGVAQTITNRTSQNVPLNNIQGDHTIAASFTVNPKITTNPGPNGTITPSNPSVAYGTSQTVTVAANPNHEITSITVDGVAIAVTEKYSQKVPFTNVTTNHTVSASFGVQPKVVVTHNAGGKVTPDNTTYFPTLQDADFVIEADELDYISSITLDGVAREISDYQTLTYRIPRISADHTLAVVFKPNPYITSSAGDHGSINPEGKTMVPYSQLRSFSIEADEGYFIQEIKVDGQAIVNTTREKRTYAFTDVRADHTISASFASSPTITATVRGSGTITPPGTTPVAYGQSLTYTIKANDDGYISNILVDGREITVTSQEKQEYTFTDITANHAIEVLFNSNPVIISGAEAGGSIYPLGETSVDYGGVKTFTVRAKAAFSIATVTVDGQPISITDTSVEEYQFTNVTDNHTILASFSSRPAITALAGEGGSITPPGTQYYNRGDSQTYKVTAKTGYYIASLLVDGREVTTPGQTKTTYSFDDIQQNSTIQAFFAKLPKITATASTGGTIDPKGTATVPYGSLQKYTVTANGDYLITSILVDGESIEITNLYEQLYPFVNVTTDHTISATFALRPVITATAGAGGSITPAGKTVVSYNGSQIFTVQADEAHSIASITVDGQEIGLTDLQTQSYTFKKVTTNHKIAALFTERPKITATAEEGGTINPDGTHYFAYGSDYLYVIKANQGYCLATIKVDGQDVPVTGTNSQTYQFTNIIENHVIRATFTTGQTITATAGEGGTIDPEGVISVICGASRTFKVIANKGYRIGSIIVDGLTVPVKDLYLQTYNFSHINEDHTIDASFLADPVITTTTARSFDGYYKNVGFFASDGREPTAILQEYCAGFATTGECGETTQCVNRDDHLVYDVCKLSTGECVLGATPTLVIGGSITPQGATSVPYGHSQTITATAAPGYYLDRLVVDGQDQLVLNRYTQDYTFEGVVADHTVTAWFAPGSKPPAIKITVITRRCAGEKNPVVEEMIDAFNRLKFINANKEIELEVITGDNLKDSDGNVRSVIWDPTIDLTNIFIQDSQTIKGRALTCEELQTCFDWAPEKNFQL